MLGSSVSIDDLSRELQRHCNSPEVATLLQQLRQRDIDLKEFCRRVRMMLGSEVLMATVQGLQQNQKAKKPAGSAAEQAAPSPPPPTAPTTAATAHSGGKQPAPPAATPAAPPALAVSPAVTAGCSSAAAGAGSSVMQHCVVCTKPSTTASTSNSPGLAAVAAATEAKAASSGGSGDAGAAAGASGVVKRDDKAAEKKAKKGGTLGTKVLIHALLCPREHNCTFEGCSTMKAVLARVEKHTKDCSISNLPAGQADCTTCQKWQSMIKLREHYRRKLIGYMQSHYSTASLKTDQQAAANAPPSASTAPPAPTAPAAALPPASTHSLPQPPSGPSLVDQFKSLPPGHRANNKPARTSKPQPSAKSPPHAERGGIGHSGGEAATWQGDTRLQQVEGMGMGGGGAIDDLVANLAGGSGLPPDASHHYLGAVPPPQMPPQMRGRGRGSSVDEALGSMLFDFEGPLLERDNRLHNSAGKRGRPTHDPSGSWSTDTTAELEPAAAQPSRRRGGTSRSKAQRTDSIGKPAAGEAAPPKSSRSGRTIKATGRLTDSAQADELSESASDGACSLDGYGELAEQEQFMSFIEHGANQMDQWGGDTNQRLADNDTLIVGQHVAVNQQLLRPSQGGVPTGDDPARAIQTAIAKSRSNVGKVTKLLDGGGCHVTLVCNCNVRTWETRDGEQQLRCTPCVKTCGAGAKLSDVASTQRQIVCSACLHVNLPMALPQMSCSGCAKIIKSGTKYHKDQGQRLNIKLCNGCYQDIQHGTAPELLPEIELDARTFEIETWNAKESVEYDHMVQCEGRCQRWYHYVCALYPDHVTLPPTYELESQRFLCDSCASEGVAIDDSSRLLALKSRTAAQLNRHAISDHIEDYLRKAMARQSITVDGLVVRVVSSRRFNFRALDSMKHRYGTEYPDDFPYDSRALFAFQVIDGRDVCIFAMYVQEYGLSCPKPNTGLTYISYLDTTRHLVTTPAEKRTPVYHALINGYISSAKERGFTHCHIWVAPPQAGDEYVFHCHPVDPKHGTRAMSMGKLREW